MKCQYSPHLVEDKIFRNGVVVLYIPDSDPTFAYTVGMTETFEHPELIMVGNYEVGDILSNIVYRLSETEPTLILSLKEDKQIPGTLRGKEGPLTVYFGCQMVNKEVEKVKKEYMQQAINHYGLDGFEVMQVLIFDPKGKLPWHVGYDKEWQKTAKEPTLYDLQDLKPVVVKTCDLCDTFLAKPLYCRVCLQACYCSKICHRNAYNVHRLTHVTIK
ncbi:MAG: DUF4262 domain-containing protein [Candidatus Roizmanbacteria bacterium]